MKYSLTIILILISSSFVFSQKILDYKEYYIGTGYAAGFRNFDNTNQILDRFNADTLQEKDFGNFKSPNGITFSAGTTQGFFNVEIGLSQLQQRKKTNFSVGDDLIRKDARLRINTYFVGAGVFFPIERNFGFGVNASFDYHKMKLSTREAVEKSINRASFVTPTKQNSLGTTLQMRFYFGPMNDHGTKLMIIPYYSIVYSNLDGTTFDETINEDSNLYNKSPSVPNPVQKMSHFGIKFVVTYSVRK